MNSLKTLIQITQNQLDGLQVKLTNLEISQERLHLDLNKLEEEMSREAIFYASSPEMSGSLEGFLKRAYSRRAFIMASIRELGQEILKVQERATQEFQELKKFELAQEKIEERQRMQENYKIQLGLDELALVQYQWRRD